MIQIGEVQESTVAGRLNFRGDLASALDAQGSRLEVADVGDLIKLASSNMRVDDTCP